MGIRRSVLISTEHCGGMHGITCLLESHILPPLSINALALSHS